MTITVPQFRADYPEFNSSTDYPNSQIEYYLALAEKLLPADRWGNVLDNAVELYVAHHIAMEARAQAEAASGVVPGQTTGPISSKSVDKVSVGFDTSSATEEKGGHWNLTIYGTRFLRLAKLFGAGPLQVGIGMVPYGSGAAWPGPSVQPGFTNFGS